MLFVGDVARALVDLDQADGLLAFRLPYPASAQRVLNRWVLRALREGTTPPASVPGMVEFCQERPVVDWPLNLPRGVFTERSLLLDEEHGLLTNLCYEVAFTVGVADPWAEILGMPDHAADLCRHRRDAQAYEAFRRLLAENPVLDNDAVTSIAFDRHLGPLEGLPNEIYKEVGGRWRESGEARDCEVCGHLTVPLDVDTWVCESDGCTGAGTGREWFADEGLLFQLTRVHRQFVSRPGRVVLDLAARLEECGVDVARWADYGSYDLTITFPGNVVWAVQVVDWSSPVLAGNVALPIADSPQVRQAFRVVPAHRLAGEPGYIATFEQFQPDSGVPLLSDAELLARVRRQGGPHARRFDRGGSA
ncbi:pPIWI_RE_Y domain-containing protein [Amycolatopsis samaneae]|uniref:REase associating with pPIWI RE domain-containing protein n=1 Tax=Amycolatopsis samaneae TaxID=664691 RepID=A0ABW5GXH0_9PSEU